MPELHSAHQSAGGQLTQIEVRGLRRDGEGGSFRKHLTTNCGCRTDGATIHLLEGLAVAVHVSLGAEQLHEKTDMSACNQKKWRSMF